MVRVRRTGSNNPMAFLLSGERGNEPAQARQNYRRYLSRHRDRFPTSVYELASSDWYFDPRDHRCPHDAWLESFKIIEPSTGERREARETSIRIRLLGAYHDLALEFTYTKVCRYSISSTACGRGLGDWTYDEFTVDKSGYVVHEIEWGGFPGESGSRFLICAVDIQFNSFPL